MSASFICSSIHPLHRSFKNTFHSPGHTEVNKTDMVPTSMFFFSEKSNAEKETFGMFFQNQNFVYFFSYFVPIQKVLEKQ